jgi:hypothetical protein
MIRLKFNGNVQALYYSQGYYGVDVEPNKTVDLKDDHRNFADHLIQLGWAEEQDIPQKEINRLVAQELAAQQADESARVDSSLEPPAEMPPAETPAEQETPPLDPADAPTHGGDIKKKQKGGK